MDPAMIFTVCHLDACRRASRRSEARGSRECLEAAGGGGRKGEPCAHRTAAPTRTDPDRGYEASGSVPSTRECDGRRESHGGSREHAEERGDGLWPRFSPVPGETRRRLSLPRPRPSLGPTPCDPAGTSGHKTLSWTRPGPRRTLLHAARRPYLQRLERLRDPCEAELVRGHLLAQLVPLQP
eukprot:6259688-Pyramimonas_sp.AAC.1